jgi:hypothetical protein
LHEGKSWKATMTDKTSHRLVFWGTILRHLVGWLVCTVIAGLILWLLLSLYQEVLGPQGSLGEPVFGILLFPIGATELICAYFDVKLPTVVVPLIIGCGTWGFVLYGGFCFVLAICRRYSRS